jgi:chorismate synthase
MNTFWQLLRITTFWESHGIAVGVVIDGFPAGFSIDEDNIRHELDRRKTGQSTLVSQRREAEDFQIVSGTFEWKSTGHPITIIIYNSDHKSADYSNIAKVLRPNHADLTYHQKYGIRDYRGGGRSSARETTARVLAGALCKQYLREQYGTEIYAYTKQIGDIVATRVDYATIESNDVRTADPDVADAMQDRIKTVAGMGDTIGGILECRVLHPLKNLWEPTFGKIKARLADAMLSIGGVLGFEYGPGFDVTQLTGTTYNEGFVKEGDDIVSPHNRYGGILGGITTGEDIVFRIAIKPTSSIYQPQQTVDTDGNTVDFQIRGRHDPCVLPRAVPIVESMTALVLMDLVLIHSSR